MASKIPSILAAAAKALPTPQAPAQRGWVTQWVRSIPFFEIVAADAACRRFAERREWGQMSNDVAAQLHLRVECAIHLVDHGYLDDAAPSIPEGEVLELLLIDFWIGKGIEWTASRYGPPPTN